MIPNYVSVKHNQDLDTNESLIKTELGILFQVLPNCYKELELVTG